MPVTFDVSTKAVSEAELSEIRSLANQLLRDPSASLLFIRISDLPPGLSLGCQHVGPAFFLVPCGVGGKPVLDEPRYLFFREKEGQPLQFHRLPLLAT